MKPCVLVQDATIPAVRVSFVCSSVYSRGFAKQRPRCQAFELCSTHSKAGSDLFALHLTRLQPPSPMPPPSPPQRAASAPVAWNAAGYTACNVIANPATVGAIAGSLATLKACHVRNPADSTECTADETTTLRAEHSAIATARATCLAADYLPGSTVDYTGGESPNSSPLTFRPHFYGTASLLVHLSIC